MKPIIYHGNSRRKFRAIKPLRAIGREGGKLATRGAK